MEGKNMPNKVFKKGLVVGIILLFIGLAFIPSFNALSIKKDIEEYKPVFDDIEKDCFECQKNGKTHLAEQLLNRLEKYEVFTNLIDLDNPGDRPICDLLQKAEDGLAYLEDLLINILDILPEDSMHLRYILQFNWLIILSGIVYIIIIGGFLNCW
jgi:hypothetical protein